MSYRYIYGPIASRRLGKSLGIAPITGNYCNYGCVYCQLGTIVYKPNEPAAYFSLDEITADIDAALAQTPDLDVISIVGDGEPTLHENLIDIITHIRTKTAKPIAVITNGSLLHNRHVRAALNQADIVLPSFDAYDAASFKRINRPYGNLSFKKTLEGLRTFSQQYPGKLWLEMMFMEGVNTSTGALECFKEILKTIRYDRLYLNTPVRPPRKKTIQPVTAATMRTIQEKLGGIPLDYLSEETYQSLEKDPLIAIKSLVSRHPMTTHEIEVFLKTTYERDPETLMQQIKNDPELTIKAHGPFQMVTVKT